MPPKRKALADTSTNTTKAPKAKASKTSSKSSPKDAPKTAPKKKSTAAKAKTQEQFKYCNANTLSKKPKYMNLQWPNFYDFKDDKNQDLPKNGELIDAWCNRVSDLGIPFSEDGAKILEMLDKEVEKRDSNVHDVILYNDWDGWGVSEVMENLLKDFNRDIFKKTMSPYKKWAYVEGLAVWFKGTDLNAWIHNDDGEGTKEIVEMIGLMTLTTFDMLKEHDLFKIDSEIKTIGIVCLLLLEFLSDWAEDLDVGWGCEIVRMCDEAGIDLRKQVRKQVGVDKKRLKEETGLYKEKLKSSEFQQFANKEGWKPKDDIDTDGQSYMQEGNKMWYRWDWTLEYKEFQKNHKGGKHYDI